MIIDALNSRQGRYVKVANVRLLVTPSIVCQSTSHWQVSRIIDDLIRIRILNLSIPGMIRDVGVRQICLAAGLLDS